MAVVDVAEAEAAALEVRAAVAGAEEARAGEEPHGKQDNMFSVSRVGRGRCAAKRARRIAEIS